MRTLLWSIAVSVLAISPVLADDDAPIVLKLVAKKDKYAWDRDRSPKEFAAAIEEANKLAKDGKLANFPRPSTVDLVLQLTNTSKKAVTVNIEGDPNVYTFELKGPGVAIGKPLAAFTADFKLPKQVVIEAGKSHDIPVKSLADGFRGASRYVYFTAPGEYTLTATYQLATNDGGKAGLLKSEAVKIVVEEPKK